MKKTLREAREK